MKLLPQIFTDTVGCHPTNDDEHIKHGLGLPSVQKTIVLTYVKQKKLGFECAEINDAAISREFNFIVYRFRDNRRMDILGKFYILFTHTHRTNGQKRKM